MVSSITQEYPPVNFRPQKNFPQSDSEICVPLVLQAPLLQLRSAHIKRRIENDPPAAVGRFFPVRRAQGGHTFTNAYSSCINFVKYSVFFFTFQQLTFFPFSGMIIKSCKFLAPCNRGSFYDLRSDRIFADSRNTYPYAGIQLARKTLSADLLAFRLCAGFVFLENGTLGYCRLFGLRPAQFFGCTDYHFRCYPGHEYAEILRRHVRD